MLYTLGMNTEPKLLPTGPMARRLRIPVSWLREEAEAGRIPAVRAGSVFLFNPKSVERVLLARATTPAAVAGEERRGE